MSVFTVLLWILCLFILINGDRHHDDTQCTCVSYDGPAKYKNADGTCKYCSSCNSINDVSTCNCKSQSYCIGVFIGIGIGILVFVCLCCCLFFRFRKKCMRNRHQQGLINESEMDSDIDDVPPIVVASDVAEPPPQSQYKPVVTNYQELPKSTADNNIMMNSNYNAPSIGMDNIGNASEGVIREEEDGVTLQ